MLSFVCWKWQPRSDYRSIFEAVHVNTLLNMLKRHYHKPFELVCITDNPVGISSEVKVVPLWDDHKDVQNASGPKFPSCYRRLKLFAPEMRELIGERIVSIDLDVVIVDDITPLFDREEDFVIWGSTIRKTPYCGSMFMMSAGTRRQVWEKFHPIKSPRLTRSAGIQGSDQAWIGYVLGWGEAQWTPEKDGVHCYRWLKPPSHLPANARMVFFNGSDDPWMPKIKRISPWVVDHYR